MTGFKPTIHPTCVIDQRAQIGSNVSIGAYSVIGADVVLNSGCQLGNRVSVRSGARLAENNCVGDGTVIGGASRIGPDNMIHENCVIGGEPLVHRSDGPTGDVEIGSGNTIRELTTIQVASHATRSTRIGNENYVMASVQIGHDGQLANRTTLSNYCALAGHVSIEDGANLGLGVIVHQFCRIGSLAMVGASAYVSQDIAPFVLVDGRSGGVAGLNSVGLRRAGYGSDEIVPLKRAFRLIFRSDLPWSDILSRLHSEFSTGLASQLHPFLAETNRGITRARDRKNGSAISDHQTD